MVRYVILLMVVILVSLDSYCQNLNQSGYLTQDGAWCWFSDPRAIYIDGQVITGWVKSDGTVEAAQFNVEDGSTRTSELYFRLERDDHNNPAFVQTAEGHILAMYTRHSLKDLFVNVIEYGTGDFQCTEPQMIHPIDQDELEKFPRATITYTNPYHLAAEDDRLYCFGRWTGFKPNMMWSEDQGSTWSKSKVFITNYPFDPGNRPYVKYFSDGNSRIHFLFTDGHPHVEPTNSVYYAYYENDNFYRADGTLICTIDNIPFEPGDASLIYESTLEEGRAWIADIGQDEAGNAVVLYTKSPEDTVHRYWYARFVDGAWINNEICASGKWFPQTLPGQREREPYYFGGMSVHPGNANVVYLSRQVNGVFEIERWQTENYGESWTREPVTTESDLDNVRPYVPRGLTKDDPEIVIWMENRKYTHYTDFSTAIKFDVRQ